MGGEGGVSHGFVPYVCTCDQQTPSGVDTDELDSNVDDWEEETIEFVRATQLQGDEVRVGGAGTS